MTVQNSVVHKFISLAPESDFLMPKFYWSLTSWSKVPPVMHVYDISQSWRWKLGFATICIYIYISKCQEWLTFRRWIDSLLITLDIHPNEMAKWKTFSMTHEEVGYFPIQAKGPCKKFPLSHSLFKLGPSMGPCWRWEFLGDRFVGGLSIPLGFTFCEVQCHLYSNEPTWNKLKQ